MGAVSGRKALEAVGGNGSWANGEWGFACT